MPKPETSCVAGLPEHLVVVGEQRHERPRRAGRTGTRPACPTDTTARRSWPRVNAPRPGVLVEDRPAVAPPVIGPGGYCVYVGMRVDARDEPPAHRRAVGAGGALDVVRLGALARRVRQEGDGRTRSGADRSLEATRAQQAERQQADARDVHRVARPGERRVHDLAVREEAATQAVVERHPDLVLRRDADTRGEREQLLEVAAARADEECGHVVPFLRFARAPVTNRRRPS